MSAHKFWKGLTPLNISSSHQQEVPEKIVKICSLDKDFVALARDHSLYLCNISEDVIKFNKVDGLSCIDLSYHNGNLYVININGQLIKTNSTFDQREEVVVKEETKTCPHGFKTSSYKVKFKSIVTSNFGQLLVGSDGQLWGCGVMPQISLETDTIKKVPFFEGRTVFSAALGENFAAVVARKRVRQSNCDTDSDNDENDEVFATNCPQCQTVVGLASPRSQSLSETCPLGVQLSKSSEESSSTTAAQGDIHVDEESISDDSSQTSEETKIANTTIDTEVIKKTADDTETNSNDCSINNELSNSEQVKSDKPNNIFMNTDAARQFISKRLSWVSAGEDYLVEYTEKPTRIIKENISNLTSLVYEGVKTVGDKVVNLSRHVSGSSDINDAAEHEHCSDPSTLMYHCSSNCHLNDLHISTSTINSEKEFEASKRLDNLKNLSKLGKSILATELWTWGDISHGQLAIGDTIKRLKPVLVMTLTGCGLQKVSCGKWHGSVLTLDGRLLLWGYNNYHQVSFESREIKSGPKQFKENSDADRVRDMIATDHHTLVYTHSENIFYMGKHSEGFTESVVNLNKKDVIEEHKTTNNDIALVKINSHTSGKAQRMCYHWRVLSSGDISYCSIEETPSSPEFQNLSLAQKYLEEMILIYQSMIKQFLKKSKAITAHSNIYETVCDLYNDILNTSALNVLSMWQLAEKHIYECDITIIKHYEEIIYLYNKYYLALCDVIVIGGFMHINNLVDVPVSLYNLFSNQLASNKQKINKKNSEAIVALAFLQPLTRLSSYKCIIQSIIRHKTKRKHHSKDDRFNKVLSALESVIDEQEKKKNEAMGTKLFWETVGKSLDQYRTPERRLIRESKSRPINLVNPGIFSTHWFVLFNNIFIHVIGTTATVHDLETVWVEPVTHAEPTHHQLQIITPEETLLLSTTSDQEKSEWLQAFNTAIISLLKKDTLFKPPAARSASYSYSNKNGFFKDAKYIGRWLDGKLHGHGKVEWPDGKVYAGQFEVNALCGFGKMEIPGLGTYEGQWKDNSFNGYGIMKYANGDIYEGYFKDGQGHGHGIKRQGGFTSSSATIYTGDWANGVKQGYGVMDDIGKGEKYLGNWSDNKKHGCGLIVTLDGIYYEGLFMQDVLTGHGVMVFEDGTHYEGEFRSAGVFSGKGILTFCSGDKIEGSLSGAWTEGVKIANATLHLNVSNPAPSENSKPNSFGKLCVAPNQKWNGLFRHCFQRLGIPETSFPLDKLSPSGQHFTNGIDNQKIWQNVAVAISCSNKVKHNKTPSKLTKGTVGKVVEHAVDALEVIPKFGQKSLNVEEYAELKYYLYSACESAHHPLGQLFLGLSNAFNTTYGGVRVHPLLLSHAVKELKSITSRLYQVIRILFPGLPLDGVDVVLPFSTGDETEDGGDSNSVDGETVSTSTLLQPIFLPRVHPALFVLYALHNKREDDLYWRRLLKWNKQPDITLMAFLGTDPKFWLGYTATSIHQLSPVHSPRHQIFSEAVEALQQLKTTFSPIEKLTVIRTTFQIMTTSVQKELGDNYLWTMDELFPVFHFVVVRAQILQLGSEIHFIEDFLDPAMQHGELGLMFTTLKACYFQILQEKMTMT